MRALLLSGHAAAKVGLKGFVGWEILTKI